MVSASLRKFATGSWDIAALFGLSLAIGIAIGVIISLPSAKERAACDEAVHQLLTTKDPVELQRSIFLIRQLDCSVGRRLP